ncbi:hypothetical protein INT45_006403 [Circinella minor]|uniref:Nucleoporin Nup133/Nup155-like N-terminal domain-containing protein n=1 Tax=Circinella minor TaxID=1195481 RepID=A0A8H7SEW1_9FUNG|nr:hypothetical protein INT45_006403 [Circinella minor]
MLDQKSPEEIVKSAKHAATTLTRASIIDKNIVNIGEAFNGPTSGNYLQTDRKAIQPFVSKYSFTLPPIALEQVQKWKPGDASGILPEINRAYFAVENRLYLWDYVEKKDVNTYEETHPIVGVGLVKAKPDIFNPEITHVLIIATTVNISVIAVAFKSQPGEPHSLSFYRTEISTNSSGALMKNIIGTKIGRVFMLSDLGDIWELDYRREEGWFTSKCSKTLMSSPATGHFFSKQNERCTSIAVNEEGTVLYKLNESSSIQLVYLEEDGKGFKNNCAANTRINEDARSQNSQSEYLRSDNFKIISIYPTTSAEATNYQLVAVTSSGCRLYLYHETKGCPKELKQQHVRTPPPEDLVGGLPNRLVVSGGLYKDGFMLYLHKHNEQQSWVITASPNIGKMVNRGSAQRGEYNEFTNRLEVNGQVLGIAEMPGVEYKLNELASLPSEPARHFLIFTTHGMTIVTKQRPVDMLLNMLNDVGSNINAQASNFREFFELFGFVQSCALCLDLACHTTTPLSGIELQASGDVSISAVKGATQLLETLGQQPSILNNLDTPPSAYTSRRDSVALFIYRLISPIWDEKIVKESIQGNVAKYSTVVPRNKLISIQQILRKLQNFMDMNPSVYPQLQPQNDEENSYRQLYDLAGLISESISFLLFLLDSDVSKIMSSLTLERQQRFRAFTFKDLLASNNGRDLTKGLANAMIDETMAKYANLDIVIDVLEQRCGTFCNSSDVLFYKAQKQIKAAESEANTMPSQNALQESLRLLKRIAIHITYEQAGEIAKAYTRQGALVSAVELILTCAHTRDPHNTSTEFWRNGSQYNDPRAAIVDIKKPFYDCVYDVLKEAIIPSSTTNQKG